MLSFCVFLLVFDCFYDIIDSERQNVYGIHCITNKFFRGDKNEFFFYTKRIFLFIRKFFIIRFFFGKVCKCHLGLGYQSALYLVWYGIVRVLLEPLRNGNSDLGSVRQGDFFEQSKITAIVMISLGIALLAFFIVLHQVRMKKGKENEIGEKI